jgi:hypothetical protein
MVKGYTIGYLKGLAEKYKDDANLGKFLRAKLKGCECVNSAQMKICDKCPNGDKFLLK